MRCANRMGSNYVSGRTPSPDPIGARINSTHAKPSKPAGRKMIVAALAATGNRRGSRRPPVTLTTRATANSGPCLDSGRRTGGPQAQPRGSRADPAVIEATSRSWPAGIGLPRPLWAGIRTCVVVGWTAEKESPSDEFTGVE
jgi:hypothetical protein